MKIIPLFFLIAITASAQGQAALPFLQIGTSLSGNGMGEVRGSLNNGSTLMATYNPGLLGVQSLSNRFSSEFFEHRSAWLPTFHLSDLWIRSMAVSGGDVMSDGTDGSLRWAIGAGYHQTYLSLGQFVVTTEYGPDDIVSTNTGYERIDGISFGAAMQFGITTGVGVNVKRAVSSLHSISATGGAKDEATPWMMDIGLFMDAPLIPEGGRRIELTPSIALATEGGLSFSYVYSNMGQDVRYTSSTYSDPLPRMITAGMALHAGLTADIGGLQFPLVSGIVVREANDLAVRRSTDGSKWTFQWGLDDIDIGNNLLLGNVTRNVTLRRGSEFTVLGLVSFRSGTNNMPSREFIVTTGTAFHVHGLFPYVAGLFAPIHDNAVMAFVLDRLQISYIRSEYESNGVLNGTTFSGFVIGVH